jgi:adenosine deaminase
MSSNINENLSTIFKLLPKVDLHCHLPGAIRTATIIDISKKNGFNLPTYDPVELEQFVKVQPTMIGELNTILRSLGEITSLCFPDSESIERIAYEMLEDASKDGVIAIEVRFSPSFLSFHSKLKYQEIIDSAAKGLLKAQKDFNIHFGMILGITRQSPIELAKETIRLAINRNPEWNLVGIDLSGEEKDNPPQKFEEIFKEIQEDNNLGITIHAGESSGAESVKDAIEILGADRIGHGVRSIENRKVIEIIKNRQITLETCPTSNVLTGAVSSFDKHPLKQFLNEGILATINTDDPSWFNTNLSKEYEIAYQDIGLSLDQIKKATINAAHGLFASVIDKQSIINRLEIGFNNINF